VSAHVPRHRQRQPLDASRLPSRLLLPRLRRAPVLRHRVSAAQHSLPPRAAVFLGLLRRLQPAVAARARRPRVAVGQGHGRGRGGAEVQVSCAMGLAGGSELKAAIGCGDSDDGDRPFLCSFRAVAVVTVDVHLE